MQLNVRIVFLDQNVDEFDEFYEFDEFDDDDDDDDDGCDYDTSSTAQGGGGSFRIGHR